MMTSLQTRRQGFSSRLGRGYFSSPLCSRQLENSVTHPATYPVGAAALSRREKHRGPETGLVPTLVMRGAIPLLPHTPPFSA